MVGPLPSPQVTVNSENEQRLRFTGTSILGLGCVKPSVPHTAAALLGMYG